VSEFPPVIYEGILFLRSCLASGFCIDIWLVEFHPSLRLSDCGKAELGIQTVRVLRGQHPAAQAMQIRMPHNALHEPFGKPSPTIGWKDENISQISERGPVRDDAGKSNLLRTVINAKTKRILD
jgi:hypothetical protein